MTETPRTRSVVREELRPLATKADLADVKAGMIVWLTGILTAYVTIAVSLTAMLLWAAQTSEAETQVAIVTATWAITGVVVVAVALRLYKLIERD